MPQILSILVVLVFIINRSSAEKENVLSLRSNDN